MKHKHNPAKPEIRTSKFAVRVKTTAQGQRKIVGYAAKFIPVRSNDLGGFVEELSPTCFDGALQRGDDCRALFNHDPNFVLGRRSVGTLRLTVDSVGLRYEIDAPQTQWASDLLVSLNRGDISQSSYAFMVGADSWREENGQLIRTITDIAQLMDVSPVTYPATTETTSQARNKVSLRSAPAHVRERIKAKRAAEQKTKTVDGEALTADAFIIVGNADDPETWHLPYRFSTEEKTRAHLRDAVDRFDQLKGLSADVLKAAWAKLVRLCKKYGIEVNTEDDGGSGAARGFFTSINLDDDDGDDDDEDCDPETDADCDEDRDEDEDCECGCSECRNGDCDDCSNAYCEDEMCSASGCQIQERGLLMEMITRRLR